MTITDETRKKIANISLLVMSTIILLGVALTVYFMITTDTHIIEVSVKPDETNAIEFEKLYLRPGESCEYTLSLISEYEQAYSLVLQFEDRKPDMTLKNYAYLRMEKDGEVLCDTRLSELFERERISFAIDFTDGTKNEIHIVYYMPEDVGNEAQNTEADFKLLVKATNE